MPLTRRNDALLLTTVSEKLWPLYTNQSEKERKNLGRSPLSILDLPSIGEDYLEAFVSGRYGDRLSFAWYRANMAVDVELITIER